MKHGHRHELETRRSHPASGAFSISRPSIPSTCARDAGALRTPYELLTHFVAGPVFNPAGFEL